VTRVGFDNAYESIDIHAKKIIDGLERVVMHDADLNSDNLNSKVDIAALPFSQACENNKQPILEVLQIELQGFNHVLEIGSGTGQHSVHFAPNLPELQWQTSDVISNHRHIIAWHHAYPAPNLYAPLAFDLSTDAVPVNSQLNLPYDAIFTANTLHIISWALVERLFALAGDALPTDGKLIVYGPFNEDGKYTSEGNQRFDAMLRAGNPDSGIRHKEDIVSLASEHHLQLNNTYAMPANNHLLVFQKAK
jgi:cyclopropane fatty-acyl-phospholipid synthase-like methyltransferase